jgi:hypothetical protein
LDASEDKALRLSGRLAAVSNTRWWTAVFLAALAARLAWLGAWQALDLVSRFGYDPYVSIAKHWVGMGPPLLDVTHPPLYSAWVAVLFTLLGRPSLLAVQLLNVVLSSLSCLLIGFWAERAGSKALGRLAGLWAAFDPLLIFFAAQVQSEPFFIFVELLFFAVLLRAENPPSTPAAFGLGVLGGLVSLARSVFGPFAPFLFVSLFWPARRERRAALWLLLFAGWALAPGLWGLRNLSRHGAFIPLAINGGWNLWEGFSLDREEVRRRPYEMGDELERAGIARDDAVRAGEHFSRKTKAFILEHPAGAAKIIAGKFFLYWRPWPYDPHDARARAVIGVYFIVLFLLAAAGLPRLWRLPAFGPVLALFICLSLLHSVFFTSLRYRSPLEPFLCVFAAAGVLRLLGEDA